MNKGKTVMKITRYNHSILWLSEDDGFVKSQGNKIGHIMSMSKNSQKKGRILTSL